VHSAVSLFSGCGGLDLGVARAGFSIAASTDSWDLACESHKQNGLSTKTVCKDVRTVTGDDLTRSLDGEQLDLLFGGPPCPPYSKSRFYRTEKPRALEDPTADTLHEFLRLVRELKPRAFLLENVPGIAFSVHREALELIQSTAASNGYKTNWAVLNAADYGVPQIRHRFILVGWRTPSPVFRFPAPSHSAEITLLSGMSHLTPWTCAGEAFAGLPDEDTSVGHKAGGKHADLLRIVPPGDNYLFFTRERGYAEPIFKWRSRYWSFLLKLSPDRPSWTIQARRSNNMGPFHWENRILTIAEVRRLQTFPDHFVTVGKIEDQWRQIGNAVPPLLGQAVAVAIREQLLDVEWDQKSA
jgi:DNA (cytosine-5)-methyltransferase 1